MLIVDVRFSSMGLQYAVQAAMEIYDLHVPLQSFASADRSTANWRLAAFISPAPYATAGRLACQISLGPWSSFVQGTGKARAF